MITILACVITKNEAENISRCLASIQGIADEIVVVDTGSTDDTVNIAAAMGAKVYHYQWDNDFSVVRNYTLDKAKGDWIIFLDADEYLVSEKEAYVRRYIEKFHGNRKIDCITCLMEHTDGIGGTLISSNPTVRIFRKSPAIRYQGRVHERILKHNKFPVAVPMAPSLLIIRHTGYSQANKADKAQRNLALLEEDLKCGTGDCFTYYYISQAYALLNQHDKVIEFAYKALEQEEVQGFAFAHKPYVFIIQSMLILDTYEPESIRQIVNAALQKFPNHPEILKCQGDFLHKIGKYAEALVVLLLSLKAHENYSNPILANDFFINMAQVHRHIAMLYKKMNNPAKAIDHYSEALKLYNNPIRGANYDKFFKSTISTR